MDYLDEFLADVESKPIGSVDNNTPLPSISSSSIEFNHDSTVEVVPIIPPSNGPVTVSSGPGASRGPGMVFGGPGASRGPGIVSSGPGASRGPGIVSSGPGASRGPGIVSSGPGASRGPGIVSSGPGASRGPGIVSSGPGASRGPGLAPNGSVIVSDGSAVVSSSPEVVSTLPGYVAQTTTSVVSSGPGVAPVPKTSASGLHPNLPLPSADGKIYLDHFDGSKVIIEGPTCSQCNNMIIGKIVEACEKTYHPECFKCFKCGQKIIESEGFIEGPDKNPYCEFDYGDLFGPKCYNCKKPIVDDMINFRDRTYHPHHFVCTTCGSQLGKNNFREDEGDPYCFLCKENKKKALLGQGEICAKCKEPIHGEYVIYNGKKIHAEHLRCADCGAEYQGGNLYEHEGKNVCKNCHLLFLASVCGKCGIRIQGRSVTAAGKVYHPDCFSCYTCGVPLLGVTYKEKDNATYCEFHYHKLFGEVCDKCGRPIQGGSIKACGKTFHSGCWQCSSCGVNLANKTFVEVEGNPNCQSCYKKLPKKMRMEVKAKEKAKKELEKKLEKEEKKEKKKAEKDKQKGKE